MADNEREKRVGVEPEKGARHEKGKGEGEGEDKDGLKFLEQLMLLMKLRMLKKAEKVDNLPAGTVDKLEKELLGTDPEKKKVAAVAITELLGKIAKVEISTNDQSLTTIVAVTTKEQDIVDHVSTLEKRANNLMKGVVVDNIERESREVVDGLIKIGDRLDIINPTETQREIISNQINIEISEIRKVKDKLREAQVKGGMSELKVEVGGEDSIVLTKARSFIEKEKKGETRNRKLLIRRKMGSEESTVEFQKKIDQLVDVIDQDLQGDNLAKLPTAKAISRFLNLTALERSKYALVVRGDQLTDLETELDRLRVLYTDKIIDEIGGQNTTSRGKAELLLREVFTSNNRVVDEQEVMSKLIKLKAGEPSSQEDYLLDPEEDIALKIMEEEGWVNALPRGGARGPIKSVDAILKDFEREGLTMPLLTAAFKNNMRDKLAFSQFIHERYRLSPENMSRVEQMYDMIASNRTEFQQLEFRNYIAANKPDEYLHGLISYLYKVGLREGMNDMRLMALMTEARLVLSDSGRADLLKSYESFERFAFFHDKYFSIGAKEYAEITNALGVGPLQIWLGEYSQTLKTEVQLQRRPPHRQAESQKITMTVAGFEDMMQETHWAKKLIYTAPLHEDQPYRQMIVSKLMNRGEPCTIEGDVIRDIDGSEIGSMKELINVRVGTTDKEMTIESYIAEHGYWQVGMAQDIFRYTGRSCNILDDIDIGKALAENKGLLGLWKIRRYGEMYEFVETHKHEIMGADLFIYELEHFKETLRSGLNILFSEAGASPVDAKEAAKILFEHTQGLRKVGKEVFRASHLPVDDVKMLIHENEITFDVAKTEYEKRQKRLGNNIDWTQLSNDDKALYDEQIRLLQEKWNDNRFTHSEREILSRIDWSRVNQKMSQRLNTPIVGGDIKSFLNNFSYTRSSEYVKNLRGTDLKDFGGYFLTGAEKIAGTYKAGFDDSTTKAFETMMGALFSYKPYAASGANRLMAAVYGEVASWHTPKLYFDRPTHVEFGTHGKRLPNGELMTDKYARWVPSKMERVSLISWNKPFGTSLLEKEKDLLAWNERDHEYSLRRLVGKGYLTKADAEVLMSKMYGPKVFRELKKWLWFDDPAFLWEELFFKQAGKTGSELFKYIFSTK